MLYIGVDLGTSAVKLLLMDEKGDIKKNCFKRIPIILPTSGLVRTASGRLVYPVRRRHQRTDF